MIREVEEAKRRANAKRIKAWQAAPYNLRKS